MQKVHIMTAGLAECSIKALTMQQILFEEVMAGLVRPMREQLLKWVGNKQRFAHQIAAYFPNQFGTYFEPFLCSGAVLGTLAPNDAVASDCFGPLIEIWRTLSSNPETLKHWYAERYNLVAVNGKQRAYEQVLAAYNSRPNGADLLFICRVCYGGVVRFRKADGYCSTPCGIHAPMPPEKFSHRVDLWHRRTLGVEFLNADFREVMRQAKSGDIVYCDPPYSHSQTILYGAQAFSLEELFVEIERCKARGVSVALSIDGTKKTGSQLCHLAIPLGVFQREIFLSCGRSMLRRFQRSGETLEDDVVHDRLLLTY